MLFSSLGNVILLWKHPLSLLLSLPGRYHVDDPASSRLLRTALSQVERLLLLFPPNNRRNTGCLLARESRSRRTTSRPSCNKGLGLQYLETYMLMCASSSRHSHTQPNNRNASTKNKKTRNTYCCTYICLTCVPVQTKVKQKPPTSHSVVSPLDWYCTDPRSAAMVLASAWESKSRVCVKVLMPKHRVNTPPPNQHARRWKPLITGTGGVSLRFQRRFFLEGWELSSRQKKWRQKSLSPVAPPLPNHKPFAHTKHNIHIDNSQQLEKSTTSSYLFHARES